MPPPRGESLLPRNYQQDSLLDRPLPMIPISTSLNDFVEFEKTEIDKEREHGERETEPPTRPLPVIPTESSEDELKSAESDQGENNVAHTNR